MKPLKPVKFDPKSKSFHFEVNAVAASIGLLELINKSKMSNV